MRGETRASARRFLTVDSATPKRAAMSPTSRALLDQIAPRRELVGGMHGDPHDIFGKAEFGIVLRVFAQMAGDRRGLADVSGVGQPPQGEIAPLSGDDGVSAFRGLADQQGIEKAVRRNDAAKFVKAGFDAGLADVAVPKNKLVKREFRSGLKRYAL